jgi:hypothetical protein
MRREQDQLEGTQRVDDDAAKVPNLPPNLLPHLLLSVGVGTRWSYRDLAALSNHTVSIATWSRAIRKVPEGSNRRDFEPAIIDAMYAALHAGGACLPDGRPITRRQIEQAARADSGYSTYPTLKTADNAADLVTSVVEDNDLSERERVELAETLVADVSDEARRRYLLDQIARLPLGDLIAVSHAITNLIATGGGGGTQLDTDGDGRGNQGPPSGEGGRFHGAYG